MSQYLVLTAMGADRTGCVSELTKLASECGCNILDSRMAIFGLEFTFIMLLNGDNRAIVQIENKLPAVAHSLDLITMMKRTSGYKSQDFTRHYQAEYAGIDQPGVLKAMTAFFATRNIDISSLKSEIDPQSNNMSAQILFALTENTDIETLENEFLQLCEQIDVQGCIKQVNSNLL
ncbi:transcriptional regulator [Thalassomonas viridans]|uniref:Glycine cleavage system transcriptional repressor n=1 Tax=Thalassomonas viridans TaxID=137584 RepID=A0AAF0CAY5_9GAMM|nr:ACT domain-containing protein [Thalassomonas viridans]WDE07363.1 transcriptional regulator [Thalassomonas viridans]